ncbi:hypothetical protein N7526_009713 [Penicillium atrosanguineum]|nr:hypothetical protein N7526_009713 [Penicillium atrosanguineum]
MRYSFTITALSLLSSAFAITVTTPSSDTVSSDPSVISIILRSQDGSFQTKLADNVKTSDGEYTTQPNPSISNGDDYEIQIIDSAGQLAVSDVFTVKKGASDDGTTSSSSSTSSSSTSSSTTTTSSSSTSSSATSSATSSTSVTSTLTSSASSTPTSTSPLSSSGMMQLRTMLQGDYTNTPFFITGSTTSSSKSTSSNSSDSSSTSASASALPSTAAASSQLSVPKGAMALLGAAFAFYV